MPNPNVTNPVFFAPPCIYIYRYIYIYTYIYIYPSTYMYLHVYWSPSTCIGISKSSISRQTIWIFWSSWPRKFEALYPHTCTCPYRPTNGILPLRQAWLPDSHKLRYISFTSAPGYQFTAAQLLLFPFVLISVISCLRGHCISTQTVNLSVAYKLESEWMI